MIELLQNPDIWFSLALLTLLEIVLGIDNIVFIALLSNQLPPQQQKIARRVGLVLAMLMRLMLLALINWIAHLTQPLFTLANQAFSIRDLVMLIGGLFLLAKASHDIYLSYRIEPVKSKKHKAFAKFVPVIAQIILFDMVFSIDSVITAVALALPYVIMALAIIIAIIVMMVASESVSYFIRRYPRIKMLALSFILLIGIMLMLEGFHITLPRSYIYAMMGFAIFIELLNAPGLFSKRKKL